MIEKGMRSRRSKGCFDFTSKAYRLENIRYNNCIGNHAVPIDFFMEAFALFDKGIMPFDGALADQPNKIMEVFDLIDRRRKAYIDRKAKETKTRK